MHRAPPSWHRQFREALQRFEAAAKDAEERQALAVAWAATDRIRALGNEIASREGSGRGADPALLRDLPGRRDKAALALTAFRNVAVLRQAAALLSTRRPRGRPSARVASCLRL